MRFGIRVYADKVEQLIVVAWIHDDPPVLAEPHDQAAQHLCNGLAERIIEASLPWYQESECRLSGAKQFCVLDE